MLERDLIKRIPIFEELSPQEVKKVQSIMVTKKYKKGKIIFHEGDPGEAVFFVKAGRVKIYKSDEEGREYIFNIFTQGDVFAETVLLEGGHYPATAESVEDSTLVIINNKDLEKLLLENCQIALKMLSIVSQRLRDAQEQIRNLAFKDTYDRTSCMLHRMSMDHGVKTPRGIEVNLSLTRQEMASLVGTSRETVTRILSDMKKDGIIDLDRQTIVVLNENRLMKCPRH